MNEARSLPVFYDWLRRAADLRSTGVVAFVVLVLLLLMIPPNGVLNDNEEHYFAAARQFFNPDAAPEGSALLGGMPHAFALYTVVGALLELTGSFEGAQILGRALAIILYAVTITRLVRALDLTALDAVLALLAFYVAGQYLMGEEWLFRGLEPKVLAYPAVLTALVETLRGKHFRAYLWLAAATYFHFLVGAMWMMLLSVALLIDGRRLRDVATYAAAYAAGATPLLVYLLMQDYAAAPIAQDENLPTVGWIISFFRSVHHASPFISPSSFLAWAPGIIGTMVILTAAYALAKQSRQTTRLLAILVCVACVYLLLATGATAFDREGFFGPFTIFRPSSLTLLLALLLAMQWVGSLGERAAALKLSALGVAFAWAAPALAVEAVGPVGDQRAAAARFAPLYAHVQRGTDRSATFLIEPKLERSLLAFERRTDRALLVLNKFVPSAPQEILEWYRRRLFQDALFANGCAEATAYRVDYLIASSALAHGALEDCGAVVFEHGDVALIQREPAGLSDASARQPAAADSLSPAGRN
jgi:hypothetical protein